MSSGVNLLFQRSCRRGLRRLARLRGDVDEAAAGRHVGPEFFAEGFHESLFIAKSNEERALCISFLLIFFPDNKNCNQPDNSCRSKDSGNDFVAE